MTTVSVVRPNAKRKWYVLALRHLRMASRLLDSGFADGATFHAYYAYECVLSSFIAAHGYLVPPEEWTKITRPGGKAVLVYPSPRGGIPDRSAHKARLAFFNELADSTKPYFLRYATLGRYLTLDIRMDSLYYDANFDRLPHDAYNNSYRVLAEQGYDAATIKAIAREAGVAPGLLHYYFASKDELLVEVLKDISQQYTESGHQMSATVPAEQLGAAGLNDALQRTLHSPETYRLRYELFALGLRNPALLPAVRSLLASGRSGISHVVHSAVGERSFDTSALASLLLACFDGLALQRLAEPDFDIESAYRLLSRMLNCLMETT